MKYLARRVSFACAAWLLLLQLVGLAPSGALAQSNGRKHKYKLLFIISYDLRPEMGA